MIIHKYCNSWNKKSFSIWDMFIFNKYFIEVASFSERAFWEFFYFSIGAYVCKECFKCENKTFLFAKKHMLNNTFSENDKCLTKKNY